MTVTRASERASRPGEPDRRHGVGGDSATAAELRGVSYTYPGAEAPALRDVTLGFSAGRHHAILGPNGAGKSTLLRLVLGLLQPASGAVYLEGRPVEARRRREVARRVGVVTQEPRSDFPLTVRSYVEMGRHPYLRPWQELRPEDSEAVRSALARVEMGDLAERLLSDLSGGELQRVRLARALAQEPRLMLLDEPTAHLDLGHEMRIFRLVNHLVEEAGMTTITVTHNLHLASRFASRLVLLVDGEIVARGAPREVLRAEPVERAFGWPVHVERRAGEGAFVVPLAEPRPDGHGTGPVSDGEVDPLVGEEP